MTLSIRPYRYLARPRLAPGDPHADGVNCRSLVQDWFDDVRGVFLPQEAVEQPGLWDETGVFVPFDGGSLATGLGVLDEGTVVLAERIRDAADRPVDRSEVAFASVDEYRLHLHTAIILGPGGDGCCDESVPRRDVVSDQPMVLHATAVEGSTCVWGLDRFLRYYRPVAAKRIDPRAE